MICLLVGIFMIGVVSAEQLDLTDPNVAVLTSSCSGSICNYGTGSAESVLPINGGSFSLKGPVGGRSVVSGTYSLFLTFNEPRDINKTYVYTSGDGNSRTTLSLVSNGQRVTLYDATGKLQWGDRGNENLYGNVTELSLIASVSSPSWSLLNINLWAEDKVLGLVVPVIPEAEIKVCSSSDQTIMKFYNSTNSHGALWNDSNYGYDICYDEIFGSEYTGINPHECTGTNRIISLSDVTNAHVSTSGDDANYPVDVCYGDLVCEYDSSVGNLCSNGGEIIARIYSETNSHISNASDINYPIKICCGENVEVIPELRWENTQGVEISESSIGDTVRLVYTGAASGDFVIKESDVGFDDSITSLTGAMEDGNFVAYWKISAADLDKTDDYDKFYFEVNGEESGYLEVSTVYEDSPLELNIVSPDCGDYFNVGDLVNIVINAVDDDDMIVGNLTIDGVVEEFTNGVYETSYNFPEGGNYQIEVNALNGRGMRKRDISNVMVINPLVNDVYVAACIAQPEDYSNIDSSQVWFDASTTLGIDYKVSGGVSEIKPGSSRLTFDWTFSDGRTNLHSEGDDELSYKFYKNFNIAGNNWAKLQVSIL